MKEYDQKYLEIRNRVQANPGISIFQREDSFSYKNQQKTLKDYEKLSGAKVAYGHGVDLAVDAVWSFRSFSGTCVIFLFLVVLALTEEKRMEVDILFFSLPKGRQNYMVKKVGKVAKTLETPVFTGFFAGHFYFKSGLLATFFGQMTDF